MAELDFSMGAEAVATPETTETTDTTETTETIDPNVETDTTEPEGDIAPEGDTDPEGDEELENKKTAENIEKDLKKYKFKAGGQEQEKTLDEIIKMAQLSYGAQDKFDQADIKYKEAEKMVEQYKKEVEDQKSIQDQTNQDLLKALQEDPVGTFKYLNLDWEQATQPYFSQELERMQRLSELPEHEREIELAKMEALKAQEKYKEQQELMERMRVENEQKLQAERQQYNVNYINTQIQTAFSQLGVAPSKELQEDVVNLLHQWVNEDPTNNSIFQADYKKAIQHAIEQRKNLGLSYIKDKTVDDLEGMLDNKQKEELKKKYIEEFKKMDRANKRKKREFRRR